MTRVEFIAEIGNNHNGCIDRAKRLVLAALDAGANVAKFQIRDFANLYRGDIDAVEDLGVEYTKEIIRKYELTLVEHEKLFNFCNEVGIEYLCTPWDKPSLDFLEDLGVSRYKISSADFNNLMLLEGIIKTGKPLILSTGMATDTEINERCQFLNDKGVDYVVLHCVSTYPAPFEDIQLAYIKQLQGYAAKVGYSGHERGVAVSLAAIALGAQVVERHLTEDKNLEGPDHQASLLPAEFAQMVEMASEIGAAMPGSKSGNKSLSQGALLNKEVLGKSIVASRKLLRGHILKSADLEIRSPGQGLPPDQINQVLGKQIKREIAKHDFILPEHFVQGQDKYELKFKAENWGIPVRPHDVRQLDEKFNAPVYEFHISYKDLTRPLPDGDLSFLSDKKILVHAPELFENSKLLDLCDEEDIDIHLNNLNRVCEFSRLLAAKSSFRNCVGVIVNIGGFSTHQFRHDDEKKKLYQMVSERLSLINEDGCEILIQNMAPFPWHFGGQRYQNLFCYPDEIARFCESVGRRIVLDTSHLSMHCSYRSEDFYEALTKLKQYVAHWHISDANGINGEGVQIGSGEVDFKKVMAMISTNQTFIVETWQGHKNFGAGFFRDLKFLDEVFSH